MLYSVRVAAKGASCPKRSDTGARQTGSLAYYIIIARPAIVKYSSTCCSKSNQLELLSWSWGMILRLILLLLVLSSDILRGNQINDFGLFTTE
jgi:hypothetical protein